MYIGAAQETQRQWQTQLQAESKKKALIYVCRFSSLERDLKKPGVANFIKKYGYESTDPAYALERLRSRLAQREDFPHEIGLFLGYPLGDVKGFIEHHGKEYLCSGYWKVYQDEQKAKSTFQLYQSVRDAVLQLIVAGSNLYEISYQA